MSVNIFVPYVLAKEPVIGSTEDLEILQKENVNASVLYVGGSGIGNYTHIQDAIENASDGDTVFVYTGTYYENIIVNKELIIIGQQKQNTIIDGGFQSTTVLITASNVRVQTFTIQNGSNHGVYLYNTHNTVITDTIIRNNQDNGIYGRSINNCSIQHNVIYDNDLGIFLLHNSRNSHFYNNTLLHHLTHAMFLKNTYGNTIEQCSISSNKYGLIVHYSNDTLISNNIIDNNTYNGIKLMESSENSITYNEIVYNGEGITIWEQSSNNFIKGNTIRTGFNVPPVAIDDSACTRTNKSLEINVTYNDFDRDGQVNISSVSIPTGPSHGTATVNSTTGIIKYVPDTGYNGYDTLTYVVYDNENLASNIANVTIDVVSDDLEENVSQQQIEFNQSFSLFSNYWVAQSIRMMNGILTKIDVYLKKTGDPLSNVSLLIREGNITGDIIFSASKPSTSINDTYDWVSFVDDDVFVDIMKKYYIILNTTGGNQSNYYHVGYTSNNSYKHGNMLVSFDSGEEWGERNESDLCFKIYKRVGIIPVSANNLYFTTTGQTLLVSSSNGVLSNDCDYDSGPMPLTAVLVNDVSHGSLSLNPSGSFEYIPNWNYTGADEFTYYATDGKHNGSETQVTIIISGIKKYCINIPFSINPSTNNVIYHNNFFSGTYNPLVLDKHNNIWDNSSLDPYGGHGGNYWSDYNELSEGAIDSNNNGIFDQPYIIYGNQNVDQYPLSTPWKSYDPTADFTWAPYGPISNLTIQFTDTSFDYGYGSIVAWNWSFDDGSYSTDRNPIHQYNDTGFYNVTLIVTDDDGLTDSIIKEVYVFFSFPIADFDWIPLNPEVSDSIEFNDLSTDHEYAIVNWSWDFGDGNISYIQHPNHSYQEFGTYNVCLTIQNEIGLSDSCCKPIIVASEGTISDIDQNLSDRGFRFMPGWDAAQEFVPSVPVLSRVDLYMTMWNDPVHPIPVEIRKDDPIGEVLFSSVIYPADVTTSFPDWGWVSISLPALSVEVGETYVIVLRDSADDDFNHLMWGVYTSFGIPGPYPDGYMLFRKLGFPTWMPIWDFDSAFRTYGYS